MTSDRCTANVLSARQIPGGVAQSPSPTSREPNRAVFRFGEYHRWTLVDFGRARSRNPLPESAIERRWTNYLRFLLTFQISVLFLKFSQRRKYLTASTSRGAAKDL